MECLTLAHRITEYVEEHYHESTMSVAEIANTCGYSVNYVRVLFKEQMGITLAQYIYEVRMKNAKVLLKSTYDANVKIAKKVGYDNYSSFVGAFRRITGMTPWDYRVVKGQGKNKKPIAEKICEYIEENYQKVDLTIEEIAEYAGYSANYTRGIFKKHAGITISKFVEQKRMERAKELLLHTEYTNVIIARDVGYGHCGSFIAGFRRNMGMTPCQYKAIHKKGIAV